MGGVLESFDDFFLGELDALFDKFDKWKVPLQATRLLKGHFADCSLAIKWLEEFAQDFELVDEVAGKWDTVVFPKVSFDWYLKAIPDDWTNSRLVLPQKRGLTRRLGGLAHKLQEHYGDNDFPLDQNHLGKVLGVSQRHVSTSLTHLVEVGWLIRSSELRKDAKLCRFGRWWYRCPHP